MIRPMKPIAALLIVPLLANCQPGAGEANVPGDSSDSRPFDAIAPDEVLQLTGTEPFWGGNIAGNTLTYNTPEDPDSTAIAVKRFAGRGGLSFSGTYQSQPIDITVTPGNCSDGMSDRNFPFVVTLQVTGETLNGCAWSDVQPFTRSESP